ncbi:MAG: DUF5103 domain-containing protein [Prevotellaceae bacterium]|nr:DUF5103 domain-containing protein [Prevotellaceae bacterium]
MKKYILPVLLSIFLLSDIRIAAQTIYRTGVFDANIKTLRTLVADEPFGLPVIELNSNDVLEISFDEMSHEARAYSYRVFHCNADWTVSDRLTSNDYLSGYTTASITDYALSENTVYLYTNYLFRLPNDDMRFKISGNYVVQLFEDNRTDAPVAQVCFSVVEPKVTVSGRVRGNTDTELNNRLQQLDFDVELKSYRVPDVNNEIKVVVRQNNRIDNQVTDIKPTYFSSEKLNYVNNRKLIFKGGYEYHRFDISSIYNAAEGVDRIRYNHTQYEAYLYPKFVNKSRVYSFEPDVNGKFVVHLQNAYSDVNLSADYLQVHFSLKTDEPFFDGEVYLGGEFNYNIMDDNSLMKYDFNSGEYFKTVLLKQGGYNYQYWFLPKNSAIADVERVDGSFWQTDNEYSIYVYHRPWGAPYDKLIGFGNIK